MSTDKMQTIRISAATHKDVSQYAVRAGKKMGEVGDEIVRAGLAALASNGTARPVETAPVGDGARDTLLVGALDAGAADLVRKYRDEIAARPKRSEKLSLTETAARLITTGWNRLVAVQKHQAAK